MASKDFLIHLSVVFKKFGLIANEFLSAICQFLNVGIIAENGGYPPTQNGDIRSLFWLFSLMALQN